MRASPSLATAAAGLLFAGNALAINVDAADPQSLKDAASTIAASVVSRYNGGQSDGEGKIPGLFPEPYYWWESGLAWDSLIYYAALTGDNQYNDMISEAMAWQVGSGKDYMPANQTKNLGNDVRDLSSRSRLFETCALTFPQDQSFWALAAMTAEETGFAPPKIDGVDSWLQLAQNVFNSQAARWDNDTCGGGLRWQIYLFNTGYDYKNSLSNGNFMQLAARLYASTKNETYSGWFNTTSAWMTKSDLWDSHSGAVYDGTNINKQCKDINHIQWTANTGTILAAFNNMVDMQASPGAPHK